MRTYEVGRTYKSIFAEENPNVVFAEERKVLISRAFTVPALVNHTRTLYVKDALGLEGLPVFDDGDEVWLRIIKRYGEGWVDIARYPWPGCWVKVSHAYGQVSAYVDDGDGEQHWTFTTKFTSMTAGDRVQRGEVALVSKRRERDR